MHKLGDGNTFANWLVTQRTLNKLLSSFHHPSSKLKNNLKFLNLPFRRNCFFNLLWTPWHRRGNISSRGGCFAIVPLRRTTCLLLPRCTSQGWHCVFKFYCSHIKVCCLCCHLTTKLEQFIRSEHLMEACPICIALLQTFKSFRLKPLRWNQVMESLWLGRKSLTHPQTHTNTTKPVSNPGL